MKIGQVLDVPPTDVTDHTDAIYSKEIVAENQLERAVLCDMIEQHTRQVPSMKVGSFDYRLMSVETTIELGSYVYSTKLLASNDRSFYVELIPVVPADTPNGVFPARINVVAVVHTETGRYSSMLPSLPQFTVEELFGRK